MVGKITRVLLLTDAPYLLYRAFFGLPDSIKGAEGRPVNALLGSVNMTLNMVEKLKPRAVVMCSGPESAAYRTELYPPYHAARPTMPDDLAWQWERAPALWEAFGWTVMEASDVEADDLLGSLAAAEDGPVIILTGDRDMFQCVDDRVHVALQGKETEIVDVAGVRERYGIEPAQVPDFIALRGDPSDGIPGGKGIGAKTAADLLQRHGTLDKAIEAAIREKPSVRSALIGQADELRMFRELALLRTIELERPPDRETDREGGAAAAEALGMRRLAERLRDGALP
jgi:DNA polymerase-1